MNSDLTTRQDDLETWHQQYRDEQEQNRLMLKHDARSIFRAMEGWQRVEGPEGWQETVEQAIENYRNGRFLITELGAARHLEPEQMATLWKLRQQLIAEGTKTAAESMLADVATMSYYNTLRIQRWIGDLSTLIEFEFFGEDGPSAKMGERYGTIEGLNVEEHLKRLAEELLPLQERSSRMMVRALNALSEQRRKPSPSVAIGKAEQVNVGAQQVNVKN